MSLELNPAIAEYLAEARQRLAAALVRYQEAQEKVQAITNRITASQNRQRAITAARLAGESNEAETAEFAALGGDIVALEGMLADARTEALQLSPANERNEVTRTEQAWTTHQAEVKFAALEDRAQEIEKVLLDAVVELERIGRYELGHVPNQSYRPSSDLSMLIKFRQIPQR